MASPSFGTLLRLHRRRLGLTQEDLAERAGFSPAYIKKLEGGSRRPSASSADVLAHVLVLESGDLESFRAARTGAVLELSIRQARDLSAAETSDDSDVLLYASQGLHEAAEAVAVEASTVGLISAVAEERRFVTVLFCDFSSFTTRYEPLDPEDVRDIQSAYFSTMKREVERFGGTLERHGGEAVLALFGVSTAHEDDPERAVLCALGMQEAMAVVVHEFQHRLGVRAEQPQPREYPLQIGINTGEVVSGPRSGAGWEDVGVSGDAVNQAARLQASAEPGEILVGQETMHLTRSRIRYGDGRKLNVKGLPAHDLVFPALGLNQTTEGLWQAVHETLPPASFIGRDREMESLSELWDRARSGEGQLVSIVGEPGVGKSRLIAEFVSRAAGEQEMRIVQGRCLSYGQEVSLWLIADLLRSLFSIDENAPLDSIRDRLDMILPALLTTEDEDVRLEARDVLGEVLGLSASESMVTKAGAEVRREALVRSLRRILAALSSRGPVILVLQDLHWIDGSSTAVLGQIAVEVPGLRLLVLVAQREGWTPPWSDLGWPERINLRPLPVEDAAVLAATVLGNVPLSVELESYLAERAGGNPFFVEELSRSLRESGALQQREGCMQLIPDVAQRLPTTLAEVLQARLDHLEAPVKSMAQVGSVIGRSFAARLLAEVLGEAESTLEAPLRALQQAEIAFPRGYSPGGSPLFEQEYSFKHVTMREVAYNTLVRKRRQELHLKTARAITALYPSEEYIETIAYHYLRTDADVEAAECFEKAGDRATSIYANDTAETHYRNAIERLGKIDDQEGSSRVREKLGDILLLQSRYDSALTVYEEALLGVPPDNRVWLARLHRKIADVWCAQRTFLSQALAAWDAAEAALGHKLATSETAWWREWLDIQLARMEQFYFHHLVEELAEVAKQTRPVIEVCATGDQRRRFFQGLVLLDLRRDGYTPTDETLVHARQAVEAAQEAGDIAQLGWPLFLLGFTLLWFGALGEAETTMLRALDLAERTGHALVRSMCSTYMTVLYRKRGDVERVRIWNARSIHAAEDAKRTEYVAMAAANRAWIAWKEEDFTVAESEARSAVADWESLSASYPYMFWWAGLWVLVDVAMRQERVADAVESAKMLFGPDQAKVPDSLATLLQSAIEAWDVGDKDTAKTNLTEALGLARDMAYL